MKVDRVEPNLRGRLERSVDDLPVLPTVVAKLLTLDRDDHHYFEQVLKVVEADPNFSARILMAANSAAFAAPKPITTLRAAMSRIGSAAAADLVLAISVTRVFIPRDPWERSLWRHALQVAIAARALAGRAHDAEVNPEEAYTCGLLHDIGRFVMFHVAPDALRTIDEADWDTPDTLLQIERAVSGTTHSELGALACARWRFPDTLVEVVGNHHAPVRTVVGKVAKLTALTQLADLAMFPSAMPGTRGLESADEETIRRVLEPKVPRFIHLGAHDLASLIKATAAEANAISRSLGVG